MELVQESKLNWGSGVSTMSLKINSACNFKLCMVDLFIFRCIHQNNFHYSTREKVCVFHLISMNIPTKCVCILFSTLFWLPFTTIRLLVKTHFLCITMLSFIKSLVNRSDYEEWIAISHLMCWIANNSICVAWGIHQVILLFKMAFNAVWICFQCMYSQQYIMIIKVMICSICTLISCIFCHSFYISLINSYK